jgi:hypothetical protein
MAHDEGFSPADVARRIAALGVIADPATVWAYLRTRLAERYPERLAGLSPARLPISADELGEWLDDFLDGVEAERAKLARRMQDRRPPGGPLDGG